MYIFFILVHNIIVRLITVEPRVIMDFISSLLFGQRCIKVFILIILYVGEKNILCVCKLCFIFSHGSNICNILELGLFLYFIMLIICPFMMNVFIF